MKEFIIYHSFEKLTVFSLSLYF